VESHRWCQITSLTHSYLHYVFRNSCASPKRRCGNPTGHPKLLPLETPLVTLLIVLSIRGDDISCWFIGTTLSLNVAASGSFTLNDATEDCAGSRPSSCDEVNPPTPFSYCDDDDNGQPSTSDGRRDDDTGTDDSSYYESGDDDTGDDDDRSEGDEASSQYVEEESGEDEDQEVNFEVCDDELGEGVEETVCEETDGEEDEEPAQFQWFEFVNEEDSDDDDDDNDDVIFHLVVPDTDSDDSD